MQLDFDISRAVDCTCVSTMAIIKTYKGKPTTKLLVHETLVLPVQALE